MTGIISHNGEKRLVFVSGRAHPELAREVAAELDIDMVHTTAYDFANGEIYVRYAESVRGADVFALQSLGQNDHGRVALLRLRPSGQEAQGSRADLGSPRC